MTRFKAFLILAALAAVLVTSLSVVAQDDPAQMPAAPADSATPETPATPAETPAEAETPAASPEAPAGAAEAAQEEAPLPPIEAGIIDRFSYAIGLQWGMTLKNEGENINPEVVMEAVKDVLAGKPPKYSQQELEQAYQVYSQARQMRQVEELRRKGRQNADIGEKYRAENSKKEGVVTLESGVQFKILKEGQGPSPKASDFIKMNYTGRLIDGTKFADSNDPRVPSQEVAVQQLFPGLVEAVTMMKVGSKWEITLPPTAALGSNPGAPGGPNSTYIFEIELLEIIEAPQQQDQLPQINEPADGNADAESSEPAAPADSNAAPADGE